MTTLPSTEAAGAARVVDSFGEMRRLTSAFDWATTPLGPMASWPESLRTVVDVMLSSRFSMWMAWGPDLNFFYNDAYRRDTLGVKHPWALGRPAREVWSEIWTDLEPRIESVVRDGVATWDEALLLFLERSGYREETYHTFSYSPIRNNRDVVSGLFCVVTEDTDRVIGQRRLESLGNLAARLGAATLEAEVIEATARSLASNPKDLPFVATYLFASDGLARFAGATGFPTGHPAIPGTIDPGDASAPWPAAALREGHGTTVVDLAGRFPDFPTGAWDRPPARAAVVPIAQRASDEIAGFLVVGLNPFRPYDEGYAGFLSLIAGQIAASLANARSYEEERRRAEALAELDRAKTTFFSNVSHEFRTPLTLLLGPLEETLRRPALDGEVRGELEVAQRNGLRLLKLVNSLLDFARVEAGRMRASYEPTDLSSLTRDLAGSFRSAFERAGLRFDVDAVAGPQPAYVDHDMWEKIVLNLISNAYKHTFSGGVTVRLTHFADRAVLEVRDTGEGIPPDELPRIFERFHRVENARSRTHEGTGIGLALVQELVRRHGGSIDVRSEVGEGTTFSVSIPLGTAHLSPDLIAKTPATTAARSSSPHGAPFLEEALRWEPDPTPAHSFSADAARVAPRILLADDNADMRDYVARLLRNQGWLVESVGDGQAALEAARREAPDLLLSDVMMPKLDGFRLLAELRADERTRTTPMILLSARAGEEARVDAANAGADDYLVKPFAAQELIARVGVHLELARQRREASEAIAHARDLLTRVLEQAPVGICVLRGPDFVFELANQFYRSFLPPGRAFLGRPLREVVPEAEAQGFTALLQQVRSTGVPWIGRAAEIVYDRRGRGPEQAYLNLLYHPFHDEAGTIDGVIAVVSEVTDEVLARREAEVARADAEAAREEANAAREAAENANRAKSQFLAVMSHELRTPLNAIAGHLQLLEMGIHGEINEPQRKAIERIDRSQRHLLSLINDVLNLARIEMGRVDFRIENIPVPEAVATIEPMIQPQMDARALHFVVVLPDRPLAVRGDREKLSQILLNLLTNATKFTDAPGSVTLRCESRVQDGKRMVAFVVADTGSGIPEEKLTAIFEPFVQVQSGPTRRTEGAGLGLAISHDLALGMQGDLTVESRLGVGSTFTLLLPEA